MTATHPSPRRAGPAGLAAPAPARQDRAMQPATPATVPAQTAANRRFRLRDEAATRAFARALRPHLGPGDVIALSGPIGAGKTAFARALIQDALAVTGEIEDVPSPSFTLVQIYPTAQGEIWHADLYRLTGPRDCDELGLEQAFATAITLIEWPDRLGPDLPDRALSLAFAPGDAGEARIVEARAGDPRWAAILAALPEPGDD